MPKPDPTIIDLVGKVVDLARRAGAAEARLDMYATETASACTARDTAIAEARQLRERLQRAEGETDGLRAGLEAAGPPSAPIVSDTVALAEALRDQIPHAVDTAGLDHASIAERLVAEGWSFTWAKPPE